MTKSNSQEAFSAHQKVLGVPGIWPIENPSKFYNFRAVMTFVILSVLASFMTMEVINDLDDFTKLSEIFYVLLTVLSGMIKIASLVYHRKEFLEMVHFLKDPIFLSYPDEDDHYMAKTIKLSKVIAKVYWFFCIGCILGYAVFPIIDNKPLPFPFPYDVGKYQHLMYAFEVVSIGTSAWTNSSTDTLTVILMGLAGAHLDILVQKITRIASDESKAGNSAEEKERRVCKKLRQCVEHHLAIIKFTEYIELVFTFALFVQFLSSIIVICNTLFHFLLISVASAQFVMLLSYIIIMVSQLFLYCGYGNEIMLKSVQVAEACYMSEWYDCGKEAAKYLFIIMERSKRPLAITVMKFSKLSLTALTAILQWSYSYFALLLKMYGKNQESISL